MAGHQLWPDLDRIKGVSSQMVNEASLQAYIHDENALKHIPKLTRIKALRVQSTNFAPNSGYITDAVLGPSGTKQFRAAGVACRVIFLMD